MVEDAEEMEDEEKKFAGERSEGSGEGESKKMLVGTTRASEVHTRRHTQIQWPCGV